MINESLYRLKTGLKVCCVFRERRSHKDEMKHPEVTASFHPSLRFKDNLDHFNVFGIRHQPHQS